MMTWIVFLVLCFILYSNSVAWSSINTDVMQEQEALAIGAARKLLEEGEIINESVHYGMLRKRLPQCIIVGVRKCGTRAMLEFLGLHPQLKVAYHEIHYFDNEENYIKGFEWYRKEMPHSYKNQITIEKSPRYFIADKAPERIYKMNSTIKLIFVLRNPTVRVISDYTQVFYNKMEKGKPNERLVDLVIDSKSGEINQKYKAVNISVYHSHFERWLQYFNRDQIHIVDGDNLISHPWEETRKVETFLGIRHSITKDHFSFNHTKGFHCMQLDSVQKCLSYSKGRTHVHTDQIITDKLNKYFSPHNKQLYRMFNRTFQWS